MSQWLRNQHTSPSRPTEVAPQVPLSPDTTPDRSDDYKRNLRVGEFQVDPGALLVQSGAQSVRLKPKAMAVLLELARQPGITLTREELLDRVWKSTYVTPGVVAHAITALRRAFGDTLDRPAYIETIPRIGYRLIASVELADTGTAAEEVLAQAMPASSSSQAPGQPAASQQPSQRAVRFAWRTSLFTAMAVIGLATLLALWWRDKHAPAAMPLVISDVRRVTFAPGLEVNPRLNAGGDWLVYTATSRLGAKPQLFLQSSYGTQARPLAPGEHAERPTWSLEGRRVAYVWKAGHRCEIRIVNIDDGSRQTAIRCPADSVVHLDWSPVDAGLLAYTAIEPGQMTGTRVQLLSDDGGWRAKALSYDGTKDNLDLFPRFSPDGRTIAFRRGGNPTSDIYLMSVTGGRVTRLTEIRARISGFDWLPDGSGLVFDSDHEGRQELYSILLSDRIVRPSGLVDATTPDVAARDWHVTYQMERWQSSLAELPLRDGATPRLLTPSSGRDRASALSPNGRRIVFVSDRDGSTQLWSLDIASGHTERLTRHENARVDMPVISPDGQRVLYIVRSQGRHELWEYRFDDESRQRLEANPASLRNAMYASDGHSIWYVAWEVTRWALHACERKPGASTCTGRVTPLSAWRVERSRMNGVDVLLLASPHRPRELEIVAETGLRPLKKLRLPASDAWSVVDDAIWYLRGAGADDADVPTLRAFSLVDGASRTLATYPGLRPLGYTPFLVTPDRKHVILPTVTENSTDIAFARIAKAAGR